jgi:nucleoid-associated protein YgaU
MGLFSRHDDAKEQADIARANEARRKLEEARKHQAQVAADQAAPQNPAAARPQAAPGAGLAPGATKTGPGVVPVSQPAPQQQQEIYTVAKGDSLSKIAKRLLGNANDWRQIYDANRDVIGGNPDLIKPGQQLKIPRRGTTV